MYHPLKKFLPLVPAGLILGSLMFPSGCANTTTPPTGGPKDTIPPVLTKVAPLPATVNVPTKKTKLRFTFNEYVKVKDANGIFLSPPLEKKPKSAIHGKSLDVTFESDLDSNTTYTLDLTGAIADNNEGNLFPGYTLVFSTGEKIDSMCVTGLVQDCSTLMPVKGATVPLTVENMPLYRRIIAVYEGNSLEERPDGTILINGEIAQEYTFKQDYYFMMGDNRHNSLDSRYWGFVPEDHIVGRPSVIWLSTDRGRKFPKNIRWRRFLKFV